MAPPPDTNTNTNTKYTCDTGQTGLLHTPIVALQSGTWNRVPLMAGTNKNEVCTRVVRFVFACLVRQRCACICARLCECARQCSTAVCARTNPQGSLFVFMTDVIAPGTAWPPTAADLQLIMRNFFGGGPDGGYKKRVRGQCARVRGARGLPAPAPSPS